MWTNRTKSLNSIKGNRICPTIVTLKPLLYRFAHWIGKNLEVGSYFKPKRILEGKEFIKSVIVKFVYSYCRILLRVINNSQFWSAHFDIITIISLFIRVFLRKTQTTGFILFREDIVEAKAYENISWLPESQWPW